MLHQSVVMVRCFFVQNFASNEERSANRRPQPYRVKTVDVGRWPQFVFLRFRVQVERPHCGNRHRSASSVVRFVFLFTCGLSWQSRSLVVHVHCFDLSLWTPSGLYVARLAS